MAILHITKENFEKEVLQSKEPVVVDFWASWCGPCKALAPILEEVDAELAGTVKVAKINIDEEEELAAQFRVMSIPTLLLFKNGEVVNKSVGLAPKEEVVAFAKF
ncbi:MAG: thioredoxin [Fusobacterium mortiferum]|jgi:thioredoxin 1|uniref:Thioredoxin n=2 Tax=Fusobacterium mortiferum TaxID=850 RepID=A0A414PXC0_FUSMR|nr:MULTISPECIES: thioredoxin [Fusobacterium]AVQ17779.1 thioredoxin [Fusobacterium mortiferum ATCC 9817]EEO36531.1 thioredoxin [Fusobacterium mortiferum ATCC 9817]MCF2626898.1 thioredoxin [Fusobacterium mortiferum]MCF2698839.1 thioredoxin [Fusobacterium mortiferum]MCI6382153.1 thioredoxin [Fusobacterium mortiferum]